METSTLAIEVYRRTLDDGKRAFCWDFVKHDGKSLLGGQYSCIDGDYITNMILDGDLLFVGLYGRNWRKEVEVFSRVPLEHPRNVNTSRLPLPELEKIVEMLRKTTGSA